MRALPTLTPDWFKDTALGIEVEQFIGIVVLVLIAGAVHFTALQLLRMAVRHRAGEESREFWLREVRRLNRGLLGLVVAITALVGVPVLGFDADVEDVVNLAARLLAAGSAVIIAYRAIDIFADYLLERTAETETKLDDQLVPLVRSSMKIFVAAIGILFVLQNLDVNIASLIAGLGIGGLAVALAAQDTIKNLLGGVTIFADKPFQVGDWVLIGDIEGTVETVGFRSSRVRTFYNSIITVPNARMTDTPVDNMGARRWRRYTTTLGMAYHTDPDRLQAFVEGIRALIRANPDMRKDYYIVEFHGFGSVSLDVLVYCFIDAADWNAELRTRHVLNLDIIRLAQRLEVEFAFPTQTLHVVETPENPFAGPGARSRDELGAVVDDFGPDGEAGQRVDQPLTAGYDNG